VSELAHALVPFTAAPTRAQALAERIAMTLKVPPGTIAIPAAQSSHPAPLPSNRPHETGPTGPTAAPWTETRGGGVSGSTRMPLAVASLLLGALLVVGGTVVWRARSMHPAAGGATTTATPAPPPEPATTTLPTQQAAPDPAATATAAVTNEPRAASTTAPATTSTARKGAGSGASGGGRKTTRGDGTSASTAKPETGIPNTRD
jgi:hypothetical protein